MKKFEDSHKTSSSGLFLGSEPLQEVRHRMTAKKDVGDDDEGGLPGGDDDATDTETGDSDGTDKGDTGDDTGTRDADGKD